MAVKISSNRGGLHFTASFNISELEKNVKKATAEIHSLHKAAKSTSGVKILGGLGEGPKIFLEQHLGAIERVKKEIKALREFQAKAPAQNLPNINKELQAYEKELARLLKMGKAGFSDMDGSAKKVVGTLNRLEKAAQLFGKAAKQSTSEENIARYNRKLQETQREISRLKNAGKEGFDAMGRPIKEQMGLLQKLEKLAKLYRDAMARTNNTELISKYNAKLEETRQRMQQVSNMGKAGFDSMGNAIQKNTSGISGMIGSLRGLLGTLGIVFGITQLIQFGRELFSIAKKAEGVELAFARIGNTKQLQQLRNATKGTVDDLQLMQSAVKASNFKIPLDTLGKGLAFAQQRAKDTGQEVDYLVESLVNGIGRKSPLILDNLGLSVIEVQTEFQKTGDFAIAVGNIIDREMERSGRSVDGLSEKSGSLATKFANAKASLADFLRMYFDSTAVSTSVIGKITEEMKAAVGEDFTKLSRTSINKAINEFGVQKRKLLTEQRKIEKDIEAGTAGMGTQFRQRQIKEELTAIANVNSELKKTLRLRDEAQRQAAGMLSPDEIEAKIADLRRLASQQIVFSDKDKDYIQKLLKEADDWQAKLDAITGKGIEKRQAKEESAFEKSKRLRQSLIDEIDRVEAEYNRKSKTREEEELQAVRDRFKVLKTSVIEFNKTAAPELQIDVALLKPIQDKAETDLKYRQGTEKLKIELEKQKQLYADFENYRKEFGLQQAIEMYRGELEGFKTYLSRLKSERDQLTNKGSDLTGPEAERLKEVEDRIKQEELLEQKKYLELLKTLKTYEQERSLIIEDYQSKRQQLLQNGAIDEVEQLDKIHKKALAAFDDAEVKRTDLYKEATEKIVNFTEQAVKEQIAKNKLLLKDERISAELRAELVENIKELEKDLAEFKKKNLVEGLAVMAATLRESAGLMAKFDQETAKAANTVANLVEGIAGIAGGLASGNPLAVIGGAVAAITAIYDLIDNTDDIQARNEAKRQKQLEKTQIAIESINRLLDQQARIIDRALGTDRIDAFNRQVKLITSDLVSVIQRINQIDLSRIVDQRGVKRLIEFQTTLQNLAQEAGRPVRGGGAGGTLKTINEVIEANRKEISTLYSLLESGVLDGDTEQLRELLQAYEQLEQQLEEYRNRLKEVVTGTTLISIVDSLADGFKRGYKSAEDFADNFEELMKNAVLQSLKMQALEKPLQQFYDQLAIDSESGGSLDADEIEKLRILYQSIIESAGEQFKQLQELTGLDFSADAAEGNKQGALAGAIKGITADQADVLAGQFNGQRIASLQILEVSRLQLNVQLQQYTAFQQTLDVARQSVNYLEGIEHNTRQTVERLDVTNTRLAATVDRLASMDRKMDSTNDVLRANGL